MGQASPTLGCAWGERGLPKIKDLNMEVFSGSLPFLLRIG